ncbi:MAG: radical SAM protein [Geobacteraceae bacterium]|nr:radical SAM protein [Geobacteraceae bacterium]
MGPVGEGESLILRVSSNCPWNQCLFCPFYKGRTFSIRTLPEIEADITVVHRAYESLEKTSWDMGFGGSVNRAVIDKQIKLSPGVYGKYPFEVTEAQCKAFRTLSNVGNWMTHGARNVFLQDANALSMKPADLLHILHCLRKTFPSVEHISCYARSRTCDKLTRDELKELHDAGLSWCYVGIESGCDDVLRYMKKGVSKKEHISGCRKLIDVGISLAVFVMPGLAGAEKSLADRHIQETIQVLNVIRPTEVRVRSLAVLEGSPLYMKWKEGEFTPPTEDQNVEELRRLIEGIEFDCSFETLQLTNVLTLSGQLCADRGRFLKQIETYQELPLLERARYLLCRYMYEGYVECVRSWGLFEHFLHALILDAVRGIEEEAGDAMERVERAVFTIKSKGIP